MTAAVDSRATDLERRLGGLPHAAVLEADERGELCAAGRQVLDGAGFHAELVPPAYGGRLVRLDDLVELTRVVSRRDPALAVGYGLGSFVAASSVWAAGRADQCRYVADLLLDNRTVASAGRARFAAVPDGARRLLLSGRHELVAGLSEASALVLLAVTAGGSSPSLVLMDVAAVPSDRVRERGRYTGVGMRGVPFSDMELRDCPVPETAVLGTPGGGGAAMRYAFQLADVCLPAVLTGALDTGIRTTMRFAARRVLHGRTVDTLPAVRAALADAFTDLLVADAVGTVAARALHVVPEEASLTAPAARFVVVRRVTGAMDRLSTVLGAQFYLRDGEYGIFQKLLRDVATAGVGHATPADSLLALLPRLPALARHAWTRGPTDSHPGLYRRGAELPLLLVGAAPRPVGRDTLAAALAPVRDAAAGADPVLGRLADAFRAELADLAADCRPLDPLELGSAATAEHVELAARYATVRAAAACLNVWAHERRDRFLGDPAWAIVALHRLARSLGLPVAADPAAVEAHRPRIYAELGDRFTGGRTFDLADRPLQD